jgi:hypothetical protein
MATEGGPYRPPFVEVDVPPRPVVGDDQDTVTITHRCSANRFVTAIASDEGVRATFERSVADRTYEIAVELDSRTSHWVSEAALEDSASPADVLEGAVRSAARRHREFVLEGLLSRMTESDLAAILLDRIKDEQVAESTAVTLMKRVSRIG